MKGRHRSGGDAGRPAGFALGVLDEPDARLGSALRLRTLMPVVPWSSNWGTFGRRLFTTTRSQRWLLRRAAAAQGIHSDRLRGGVAAGRASVSGLTGVVPRTGPSPPRIPLTHASLRRLGRSRRGCRFPNRERCRHCPARRQREKCRGRREEAQPSRAPGCSDRSTRSRTSAALPP